MLAERGRGTADTERRAREAPGDARVAARADASFYHSASDQQEMATHCCSLWQRNTPYGAWNSSRLPRRGGCAPAVWYVSNPLSDERQRRLPLGYVDILPLTSPPAVIEGRQDGADRMQPGIRLAVGDRDLPGATARIPCQGG